MFIVLRTLFLSLFLAVIFTPLARLLALKIGFVDIPNERKIHNFPMALMGGWAIYLSLIITLGFNKLLLDGSIPYLLISGLILLLIGTLDERGFLHPQIKLMAVMPVVGLIMVISGVKFNIFYSLFNNSILDILLTIFWFTGFIASFEIIDHMDGLNSGLTFIAALFFSVFFLNSRNYFLVMAGQCLMGL